MEQTEPTDTGKTDSGVENQYEQVDGCGFMYLMKGKKYQKMESVDEHPVPNNEHNKCGNKVDDEVVTPHFVLLKKLDAVPSGYLADPDHVYNMNHIRRGKMIVISNRYFLESSGLKDSPRHGTEFDSENLRTTFSGLGFDCEIHEDKTCGQMLQLIINASESTDYDCDCMAFAFLSHGDDSGLIYGTDQAITIDNLLAPLKHSHNMRRFAGIPKLVFIQACRGVQLDFGADVTDGPGDHRSLCMKRVASEADFLFSYSTAPGYFSFRGRRGSVYIRALCLMLRRYQSSLDLATILTRVCHEIAYLFESNVSKEHPDHIILSDKKQMPSTVSTLTKDLFFVPKQRVIPVVDFLDHNTV